MKAAKHATAGDFAPFKLEMNEADCRAIRRILIAGLATLRTRRHTLSDGEAFAYVRSEKAVAMLAEVIDGARLAYDDGSVFR